MAKENLGLITACGDQIEYPLGQSGLMPEFQEPHGRLGHKTGGFQHHGISRGNAQRCHPAMGNHGGKIPGRNTGKNADGMPVKNRVISGGSVHQGFSLHQVGGPAGKFDHFVDFQYIAHAFPPVFTFFLAQ